VGVVLQLLACLAVLIWLDFLYGGPLVFFAFPPFSPPTEGWVFSVRLGAVGCRLLDFSDGPLTQEGAVIFFGAMSSPFAVSFFLVLLPSMSCVDFFLKVIP